MKTNGIPLDGNGSTGLNGSGKDDAQWAALRYVLGEMTAEEAEAYEQTLSTDLQACEQVAAAARLTADIFDSLDAESASEAASQTDQTKLSRSAKPVPSADRAQRGGLWAVVGLVAAVCLLVAGGLSFFAAIGDHEMAVTDQEDAGAGSLVAIWTEQSAEAAAASPTLGLSGADRLNADNSNADNMIADNGSVADDDDDPVLIADDDYDVPGWMIAAVENGKSFSPDSSPNDVREN